MTNKWRFNEKALTVESRRFIWIKFSNVQRVSEDDFKHWILARRRPILCPPESPLTIQVSLQFLIWLLLLAALSNQCPQTLFYELHWVEVPQSPLNPTWSWGSVSDSLSFSRALCFRISTIFERELLIMEVQQLEGIVNIVLRNLHACLTIWGWGKTA